MTVVKDIMTPDVITASLPGTREDVIEVLRGGGVSSIPVVKDGEYRGLVSRDDLLEDPDEDQLALLMREVPTVEPDTTVEECAEIILEKGERRIPVVIDSTLEGIVTVTDLIEYIAELGSDENVGNCVENGVLTLWVETPMNIAVHVMMYGDETAACVLDDRGKMVGIVTEVDAIRSADVDTSSEKVGEGLADEDDEWMWEGIKSTSSQLIPISRVTFPREPVSEFMTTDVTTVVRKTDVSDAAKTMLDEGYEQLPLMRGDNLLGMVKDINLLKTIV
ncbi:MAG: CBS domain-containing protein [Halobacteria archaeon]|nr:CBS domain-containing protein [Halobacteria archaeon]